MNIFQSPELTGIEKMQAIVSRCPFHQWLNLKVTKVYDDGLEVQMPWRDELVSNPERQTLHGGILAAMIDAISAYAVIAKIGHTAPTVNLHTDYHSAAPSGRTLTIRSRVVHLGKTLATGEAHVFDETDKLIASGRGTYYVVAPKR